MPAPLVSTIIPTYNRARDVVRAVESALAQTYPSERHEILVVDDGSRDDGATAAALAPFAGKIKVHVKPNGGVSSARNYGIARAKGDLVAFLDSDDEWLPEKLETQVQFLEEHPQCGAVLCEYIRLDHERRPSGRSYMRERFLDARRNVVQALRFPGLAPSLLLVRRSVLDKVGGFDESLRTAEDVDLHLRIAWECGIGLCEEVLARYRMGHEDGLSHGRDTYADFMFVISRFVERHAKDLDDDARAQILTSNWVNNARGLIVGGWYGDGLRFAVAGAKTARRLNDAVSVAALGVTLARHAAVRAVRTVIPRR